MANEPVRKDAGVVSAYGAAVRGGYTGTYEEFCQQQANYAQTAAAVAQAKIDAEAAARAAEAAVGSYDAMTATATGLPSETDPTAAIDHSGDHPVLNLGIPAGEKGDQGDPGDDGYSPTVAVTDITGGHRVTITDAEGDHTFDVMDGEQGDPGQTGAGVPAGGAQGKILAKKTATDYDTEWIDPPSGDVTSVNTKTGAVVLDGGDINVNNSAQTPETVADALSRVNSALSNLDSSIAPVETTATATAAHAVGELFMMGETLLVALSAIAIGDTITTEGGSPNAAVTTLSSKLIKDVQIAGTSILNNGVANIPNAGGNSSGVVKIGQGLNMYQEYILTDPASHNDIKAATNLYKPITTNRQHIASFYGLAKAAGDSTQSASANAVGTYTEDAKSKIHDMIDAPETVSGTTPSITAKAGVRYICGECSTLTIAPPASGDVEVIFESGTTATVLTITPPTGVTAVKWAGGFDPTNLDADTVYDVIITDGKYGVAASWQA